MAWRRRRWGSARGIQRSANSYYNGCSDDESGLQASIEYNCWLRKNKAAGHQHTVSVQCQGATHRIVLRQRGRITLVDHPDPAGEVAMAQLGGEMPRCFAFLKAYRGLFNDTVRDEEKIKIKGAEVPVDCGTVDPTHNGPKGKSAAKLASMLHCNRNSLRNLNREYYSVALRLRLQERIKSMYQHLSDLVANIPLPPRTEEGSYDSYQAREIITKTQRNAGIRLSKLKYEFKP